MLNHQRYSYKKVFLKNLNLNLNIILYNMASKLNIEEERK